MTTVSLRTHHYLSHYWSPCYLSLKKNHSITCMIRIDIMSSVPSQCQARTPVKRLVEASVWSHWPAQSEALPWASPTSDVSWGPWCSFFPGRFFTPSPIWWGLCNRFWRELLRCQKYEVETGWAIQFVVLGTRTVESLRPFQHIIPFGKRKKSQPSADNRIGKQLTSNNN